MLILCGPPGVGKTTLGNLCATRLGVPFLDTDQALASSLGMPVSVFLTERGEAALRQRERELIEQLDDAPRVLSVGGGLVTDERSRTLLKKRGFLCGLFASPKTLLLRLSQSSEVRPLLLPEPQVALPKLLSERESAYRDVDVRLCIDDFSVAQLVESICGLYRQLFLHKQTPPVKPLCETPFPIPGVSFCDSFPENKDLGSPCLLIHDERLLNRQTSSGCELADWIARFPHRYAVAAGEGLKDLLAFPHHVERIQSVLSDVPSNRLSVVAVGGGSVGDFAGFFASVWKRGVPLVQIPSTWLAAIDSAHGGKNALNLGLAKNQIGTFAPAEKVILSRAVLFTQPEERALEAMGEFAKIAFLDGGKWVDDMLVATEKGAELLWRFLPFAVLAKYRIVERDPRERLGIRHLLNLGHTLGHVLETLCGLPHGLAVAQGMYFSLQFSTKKGFLSVAVRGELQDMLESRFGLFDQRETLPKVPAEQCMSLLSQDKKRSGKDTVRFVFLRGLGTPEVQDVTLLELLDEVKQQGYVEP
jgi:3-dehydroquinate synthase